MDNENESVTSVGHALPADLQDLRKDERPAPKAKKPAFKQVEGLRARTYEPREDVRLVTGVGISGDVRRSSTTKKALPNFRVEMSSVKADRTTDDRISMRQTIDAENGIAVNIWQKMGDGTHRLVLFVTGLPDKDTGELKLEVRTRNNEGNMPIYAVTSNPNKTEE